MICLVVAPLNYLHWGLGIRISMLTETRTDTDTRTDTRTDTETRTNSETYTDI